MENKYEILIKGNISENELTQLQTELSSNDFVIDRIFTKSKTVQELLELIFQDFSVISFTRDLVLSGLLSLGWNSMKKVKTALEKKNKQVETFACQFEISNSHGKSFAIDFVSESDEFEILIKQVDEKITIEFMDSLTSERRIIINLDSDKKLKINKF